MQSFFAEFIFRIFLAFLAVKQDLLVNTDCAAVSKFQKFKQRSRVVFPLPEAPMMTSTFPRSSENEMFRNTSVFPNDFCKDCTSKSAIDVPLNLKIV